MTAIDWILVIYAFSCVIGLGLVIYRFYEDFKDGKKIDWKITIVLPFFILLSPFLIYACVRKLQAKRRPMPVSKKFRKYLKKDVVMDENRTVSIAKYNWKHGTAYTLEDVYGKKYVESLTEEDKSEFERAADMDGVLKINDNLPKDIYTDVAIAFANSRAEDNLKAFEKYLADEVKLVLYGNCTIVGKSNFIKYWIENAARNKTETVRVDTEVRICLYYNHAAVLDKSEGYTDMYLFFRIEEGKVVNAVYTPNPLQSSMVRYVDLNRVPYSIDYIRKNQSEKIKGEANRFPCLNCGCPSEKLEWHKISIDTGPLGYEGVVSTCPKCNRVVEFFPEALIRFSDEHIKEYQRKEEQEEQCRREKTSIPFDTKNAYVTYANKYLSDLQNTFLSLKYFNTKDYNDGIAKITQDLDRMTIHEGYKIAISLPMPMHIEGIDMSMMYMYNMKTGEEASVYKTTDFEPSPMGAWQFFLYNYSVSLLPVWWENDFISCELILSKKDLSNISELRNSDIEVVSRGLSLTPEVQMKGNTAIINYYYWEESLGLVRKKATVTFDGNHVTDLKATEEEVICQY